MAPEPGIYFGVPPHVYHNTRAVSCSTLDAMERSPAYARHRELTYSEPTEAMVWGTAVHCAVLEPAELGKRYAEDPQHPDGGYPRGWRNTKAYREQRVALAAEGKSVLTPLQFADLDTIRENVASHPVASIIQRAQGGAEVSVYAADPAHPVMRKVRPDLLVPDAGMIVDLKSAEDPTPAGFRRACSRFNYHRRAAYYLDTANLVSDVAWAHYLFLVVAASPPWEVRAYTIDEDSVELGRAEYRVLLARYAECHAAGRWPMGGDEIEEIRLPEYRFNYPEEM